MRRFLFSLALVLFTAVHAPAAVPPADPRTMTFPQLKFEIPKAERVVLDCGMPVYLLRDTELPIVNLSVLVHTGSVYDPPGKSGLAGLTGSVMRSGGAAGKPPEKIDDELEFMASSVESGIGTDVGTVSMSTLNRNLPQTLRLFADVLLRPDFDPKRVELAKRHLIEGLRRQNDDPKEIADREINRAIYDGHPLGAVPTYASAAAIAREDMVAFHRRFFKPGNMIMAVSGDFDRSTVIRELNGIFGRKGEKSAFSLPEVPQPAPLTTPLVLLARKAVPQTVVRMGTLGIRKDNPDLYAVRVMDYILGGSFTSRLMMEIRTNQGLAYNVDSHFDVGRVFTGTVHVGTETKAESTARTIGLIRQLIEGMRTEPVSDQELKSAKEHMINSFMFGFTSAATIVVQRARLEFFGYPLDYLERYRDNIAKVTKDDVLAAARKYLRPEQFRMVVVGDPARFDKPLDNLGPVRDIDIRQVIP